MVNLYTYLFPAVADIILSANFEPGQDLGKSERSPIFVVIRCGHCGVAWWPLSDRKSSPDETFKLVAPRTKHLTGHWLELLRMFALLRRYGWSSKKQNPRQFKYSSSHDILKLPPRVWYWLHILGSWVLGRVWLVKYRGPSWIPRRVVKCGHDKIVTSWQHLRVCVFCINCIDERTSRRVPE